jgi:Uma2 family endonuclease
MTVASSLGPLIGRDAFREMEAAAPTTTRLERMDGYVYAVAGAGLAHERTVARLVAALAGPARSAGCEVFASNRRLSIGEYTDFLPDVSVYCDPTDNEDYAGHHPCLVIEVLSRSTALDDLNLKLPRYQSVSSVEAIVLVNPEPLYVDVFRRGGVVWEHEHYGDHGDSVTLPCPPVTLPMASLA